MAGLNRGDVRYYTFKPPDKRRPVLILTRESAIPHLCEVTVAAITSTVRGVPSEVFISENDGMPNPCAVNLYHLQTVQKQNIGKLITTLSPKKLNEVRDALNFALGFDDLLG
jgi:mRNA interferase MazF